MPLYRIRKWADLYENHQSRRCKTLAWVPVPARHDGERYSELMTHPKAAEIFAAWILCLQVAAQSDPRGSLTRSDGSEHTPTTLGMKTRAPVKWFEIALPILLQMTWLEQDTSESHNAPTTLLPRSEQGAEERTERTEQKEGKEYSEEFEIFWKLYPNKKAKGNAWKSWKKLKPSSELQVKILTAVNLQRSSPDWLKDAGQFIPHPATWLNRGQWEDEVKSQPEIKPWKL